jgi:hypothetical protein
LLTHVRVLACGTTQRAQFARKTLDYFGERAHFHDFLALYQAHCRGRPRLLAGTLPAHVITVLFSLSTAIMRHTLTSTHVSC